MKKGNMNRGTEAVMREEDDFGQQEEWGEEEFDERVSVRSSRYDGSSVYVAPGQKDSMMRNSGNFGYSEQRKYNPNDQRAKSGY